MKKIQCDQIRISFVFFAGTILEKISITIISLFNFSSNEKFPRVEK